ncbi:MAG: Fic/DOC family protein [Euryarchaeota archaeon ADurb.Bin009]|jgi:Fic family protein|uniref:Fic family protein n=1 Tax=Methanoculleus sp. TaxID=90427 RepID=UPI0009D0B956|nr:Fic family protein [Methanoculleus sp.]OQC70934.1 MAG: Fic/DOC family protein [Euryarchaeota archaeon ADurb.Bin009]MBP7145215.1 Fic family protein [Methanoculleus sp.]HNT08335.1 Fic family protein [Methanoculleus sp.]HOC84817.1 Fic family protein [Methanoculleus sp.]HQL58349.1 Fic family protein [Methanoculleus sp.]
MKRYPDNRAGIFIRQEGGYDAFIPHPLPPGDLALDEGLLYLLSKADGALARLDGVTQVLPNPDLFVAMYIKKEALLSSQIEGTQASLQGILEFEAHIRPRDDINEIQEVLNYIKALHHGIEKLGFSPLSLDLMNEIHRFLIQGTRGSHKLPGRLRHVQNWIGLSGGTIQDAVFVPPPPERVPDLMKDLERFIQNNDKTPTLIKTALIHAQLETIHPYLDGNGRMGRLMITFYLCSRGVLARPLLYLSYYLKRNREEYYTLLNGIRYQGNWEAWLEFFLRGVIEVSNNSIETAKRIIQLKETLIEKLLENNIGGVYAVKLIDTLFDHPIITIGQAMEELRISRQAATKLVGRFEDIGILEEITGKERYKQYMFVDYVRIIEEGTRI